MEASVSRTLTDTEAKDLGNLDNNDDTGSESSSSVSTSKSETYSDSSVSENCGKPPPEPYNPAKKIELANERLNKYQNILEKTSRITFSETVSQKSFSISDQELSSSEERELPELPPSTNTTLDASLANESKLTESVKSEPKSEVKEVKRVEEVKPVKTPEPVKVPAPKKSQEVVVKSTKERQPQAKPQADTKAKAPAKSQPKSQTKAKTKQPAKPAAPKKKAPISNITVNRVRPSSTLSNHSRMSDSSRSKTKSKNKSSKYRDDFENSSSSDSDSSDTFDQNELSIQRSVKFSSERNIRERSKSPSRPGSRPGSSLSRASVSEIKQTKASRLLAESISSRPSTAPPKPQPGAKQLWEDDQAPESPDKLPNYMRPKSAASAKGRKAAAPPRTSYGIDMERHNEENNKRFDNLRSEYSMPKEQRELMERRQKVKAKRLKEKEEMDRETEKADAQASHEVWTAWYETSIDEAREKRRSKYQAKREERQRMQQEREEYHEDLKSKGLDVKTWTKRKLLEKRREEKEQRNLRIEIAKSQPTPVQKMKMNDRAFRTWVRRVNKREREEEELERIRRKLRNIELRKEIRAQKALQSIRAAQEEAMTFKNFVF